MDQTLHALGNLLIQAIPTILFFLFLNFFLKRVLFRPLAAILEQRRQETEGARELAQRSFDAADKRYSEFEQALQAARNEVYHEFEQQRARWAEEQAKELADARSEAAVKIGQARQDIARQVAEAQAQLDSEVESLSERITETLLGRRAA